MDTWGGRRVVLGTVTGTGYTMSTAGSSSLGILTSQNLLSGDPSLGLALGTEGHGKGRNGPG